MLVAINRRLVDKASREAVKIHNSEFVTKDLTATQLQASIAKGYAFCAPFRDHKRREANFTAAGFLAVDVDDGLSLEAALHDPYFLAYASFLYTTPSHTEERHRFRIIFELEQPIETPETMRHALTGLIVRFNADASCKDACRIFYGSSKGAFFANGKRLPESQVKDLAKRGEEALDRTVNVASRDTARTAVRSVVKLPKDTLVRTEAGMTEKLADLPERTRLYCPQHVDTHASAFALRSQMGTPGLHCSSCAATFFLDGWDPESVHNYAFDYGWRQILSLSVEQFEAYADRNGNVDFSEVLGFPIRLWSENFLPFEEPPLTAPTGRRTKTLPETLALNEETQNRVFEESSDDARNAPRVTFIRSPKGTGKTQWLEAKVGQLRASGSSVLLIGHRRSLIAASAKRLGLDCYLTQSQIERNALHPAFDVESPSDDRVTDLSYGYTLPSPYYAICADSLGAILDTVEHHYDVIVLDEVEQFISHLLSETMRDIRREVLLTLQFYLKQAKEIYALDADLHRVSVNCLGAMLDDKDTEARVLLNTWTPENRQVHLYGSKEQLIGELLESANRKERCFVCTNSKALVNNLTSTLRERLGPAFRLMALTADNAHEPASQLFIRNIKSAVLDYDVVLASPVLGTGIDITFPQGAQMIDAVFGIFEGRINTHFDVDQQLSRVRNPKRVCVWIDPQEFHFETDVNAIRAEIEAAERKHRVLLGITSDGHKQYSRDPVYETIFSEVTALLRASKNRLRRNFIDLRTHNGWQVLEVGDDRTLRANGRQLLKDSKAKGDEQRQESIVAAPAIDGAAYRRLKRLEAGASSLQKLMMLRYVLEKFYMQEVTETLVADDANGRLRDAVRNVELLSTPDEKVRIWDERERELLFVDRNESVERKRLLVNLLKVAGVVDDENRFKQDVTVRAGDLRPFAKLCRDEEAKINRLLEIDVRADVARKPTQQLGVVLSLFGLSLELRKTNRAGGKKKYIYALAPDAWDLVMSIVARRSDPVARSAWEDHLDQRPMDETAPTASGMLVLHDPKRRKKRKRLPDSIT